VHEKTVNPVWNQTFDLCVIFSSLFFIYSSSQFALAQPAGKAGRLPLRRGQAQDPRARRLVRSYSFRACVVVSVNTGGDLPNFRDDFLGHVSLPMTEFYGKRTVDKYALDVLIYGAIKVVSFFLFSPCDAVAAWLAFANVDGFSPRQRCRWYTLLKNSPKARVSGDIRLKITLGVPGVRLPHDTTRHARHALHTRHDTTRTTHDTHVHR
jgi:hypothetical protein